MRIPQSRSAKACRHTRNNPQFPAHMTIDCPHKPAHCPDKPTSSVPADTVQAASVRAGAVREALVQAAQAVSAAAEAGSPADENGIFF